MTQIDGRTAEEAFGAQVRAARESRQWTQAYLRRQLATAFNIKLSQTAMARLEQGKRPIRLNEVSALAHLLRLDISRYAEPSEPVTADTYDDAKVRAAQLRRSARAVEAEIIAISSRLMVERANAQDRLRELSSQLDTLEYGIRQFEDRAGRVDA